MIKLFDIKLKPAKLRFELFVVHRWEKDQQDLNRVQDHIFAVELGLTHYQGLQVKGTNVRPKTYIVYFKLLPVFRIVLTTTWRYQQELRLKV